MKPKRDPRKDPMPGDVLRDSSGNLHRVMPLFPGETRDIKRWRKAMRDADVLKVADEAAEEPRDKAKQIRAGELDNQLPAYEEITGWFQRAPMTWLPGLLIAVVKQCVLRNVFKEGGLERIVAASIKSAGPGCELRSSTPPTPEPAGGAR